jgi:hypothetical protein
MGYTAPVFDFSYWVSEISQHALSIMPYAICQVVAAALIVKGLSVRALFCLSCVFTIICDSLCFLAFRMSETGVLLFVVAITISNPLPFIVPVLILALAKRKRAATEAAAGAARELMPAPAEVAVSTDRKARSISINLYKRYWYVLDIVLIGLVLLYGVLFDHFGLISYVCGLYNQMVIVFAMVFVAVFFFVPASLCLLVLALRMYASWPKHIQSKSRLRLLRISVIIGLVAYLGLPFTLVRPPGYRTFTSGFKRHMEKKANIEAIRAWLSTLSPAACTGEYIDLYDSGSIGNPKWPDTIDWPESITCFDPHYAQLSLDSVGQPTIRLTWGGAFGHWGLVVGSDSMETPASDLSRWGEHRVQLCKGAYVWHEIQ